MANAGARRLRAIATCTAAVALLAACSSSKSSSRTASSTTTVAGSSTTVTPPVTVNDQVLYTPPTPAGTALGQANVARFERLVTEGLNQGHLQVMDELLSPTVVDHQNYGPGYPASRAGVKALTAALRTAFPDLHAVATTLVATNDGTQTFAIIKTTGTNTGPYLGVPPTGHKIALDIEESAKWADGKMVEHWGVADNVGLLSQMGFFPPNAFPAYSPTLLAPKFQQSLAHPPSLQPGQALTVDQKVAAVKRLINVGVNQGDIWVGPEFEAPNYVDHEFYGRGYPSGAAAAQAAIAVNATALPDIHTVTHYLAPIGDGSDMFGILEGKGTNTGPYLGIPPTNRPIDINVFEYWHFDQNGKIDVHNGVADLLGLIAELGFVPPGAVPVYSPDKVDPQFKAELALG
jgi:predicted ester cyclase